MSRLTPEQMAEVERAWAANRAAQEAMNAKRRVETGEIDLELIPASDDLEVSDSKFQKELGEFTKSLRAAGVPFSQIAIAFDSADGDGYPLAEFVLRDVGIPLIAGVAHVCAAWVNARFGRKLRLKIGDVVAEGQTPEEIEQLLKKAAEWRAASSKSRKK